ncbi:hypothetical protein RI367_008319 [Sorochytrium milnesiophthora]
MSDASFPAATADPFPQRTSVIHPMQRRGYAGGSTELMAYSDDNQSSHGNGNGSRHSEPQGLSGAEHIGPHEKLRLHRYSLWLRLLHAIGSLWMLSGSALFCAISICIIVQVAYLTFVSAGAKVIVIFAFTFYSIFVIRMLKTLLRTAMRLWMTLMEFDFARSGHGFFTFSLVDRFIFRVRTQFKNLVGRGRKLKHAHDHRASRGLDGGDLSDDELDEKKEEHEYVKYSVYAFLLILIFALPFILIACFNGFWAVTGAFFVAFTIGSLVVVASVNLCYRLVRVGMFLGIIYRGISPQRRLAMYMASSMQDRSTHIFDTIATRGTLVLLFVVAASFATTFRANWDILIPCIVLIVLLLIVRFRKPLLRHNSFMDEFRKKLDYSEYYDGKSFSLAVFVLVSKNLILALGFLAVAYLDVSNVRRLAGFGTFTPSVVRDAIGEIAQSAAKRNLFIFLLAYIVLYCVRDLVLVLRRVPDRARAAIVAACMVGQIVLTVLMRIQLPGFTSTVVMFSTFLSLDLRDGKHFWSKKGTQRTDKSYQRATNKAIITIVILFGTLLVSFGIGYRVAQVRTAQTASTTEPPNYFDTRKVDPDTFYPFCYTKQSATPFSIVDMATLASAAYKNSSDLVMPFIEQNPSLKKSNITLTSGNFDDAEGVRFLDFFHAATNTSIVAVRGTKNAEDILQDMYLWSTPSLLDMSTYFGTFIRLWPRDNAAQLVKAVQDFGTYTNLMYYAEVLNYTQNLIPQRQNVLVTGHSLGGGIAIVIGARLHIPALGISAPGLGMSYKSFGVDVEDIIRWTMNIVPLTDPVPKFDEQIGSIVNIPCHSSVPVDCHRLPNTLHTLLQTCGVITE